MGGTTLSEFRLRGIDEERALGRTRGLDLDDLFLFEAKRRVMKDRTVSLHGRLYEVDAILVGHSITLRYDPQAPTSRPPPAGPPRRPPRGTGHTPRRLRQYQASLRSKRNFPVKRDRTSWHAQPDDPAPEPRPSPLAMQKLKEKN